MSSGAHRSWSGSSPACLKREDSAGVVIALLLPSSPLAPRFFSRSFTPDPAVCRGFLEGVSWNNRHGESFQTGGKAESCGWPWVLFFLFFFLRGGEGVEVGREKRAGEDRVCVWRGRGGGGTQRSCHENGREEGPEICEDWLIGTGGEDRRRNPAAHLKTRPSPSGCNMGGADGKGAALCHPAAMGRAQHYAIMQRRNTFHRQLPHVHEDLKT